jgi:hypothetical protein
VLTDAWFSAETGQERDAVITEADRVRNADQSLTLAAKNSTPIAAEASETTRDIISQALHVMRNAGSLAKETWELIKQITSLATWQDAPVTTTSTGRTETTTVYHGAFGHSTVDVETVVTRQQGMISNAIATTGAALELTDREALFVAQVMAGEMVYARNVQLTLVQALQVLNTANTEFDDSLERRGVSFDIWAGMTAAGQNSFTYISKAAFETIVAPEEIGLSTSGLPGFSQYDIYWAYICQEHRSSLMGQTYKQVKSREFLNSAVQTLIILALGIYSAKWTPGASGRAIFSPTSRLDMIEHSIIKNGFVSREITHKYAGVLNWMNRNVDVEHHASTLAGFGKDARVVTLTRDTTVFRYYGSGIDPKGHWVTPFKTNNPVSELSLPSGNTAQNVASYTVPKGTTVISGRVIPLNNQSGGGYQFYIHDLNILI